MDEIGKNLKRIRLLKNLSLEKAGQLMNMSAPAVAKYEKGQIIPDSKKLIEFANAYSVKVLDLLKTYDAPKMNFNTFRKKQRLKGQNLELLKKMIEYIKENYHDEISLNDISDYVGISAATCNRLFKEYANKTPIVFLNNYRLEKAAEKIRNSDDSISNIFPSLILVRISFMSLYS